MTLCKYHIQDTPDAAIIEKSGYMNVVNTIEHSMVETTMNITELHKSLSIWHRNASKLSDQRKKTSMDSHNRKRQDITVNFTVVDFVLRGKTNTGHKLQLK